MKILCVLYDDPKTGMPEQYARDNLPKLDKYPDGMTYHLQKVLILILAIFLVAFQVN